MRPAAQQPFFLGDTSVSTSPLQAPFLRELADNFVATQRRIARRLSQLPGTDAAARDAVLRDELRGLYHGVLVIFDGGTALADQGLIRIVDEDGLAFDRLLHEVGFDYWPSDASG